MQECRDVQNKEAKGTGETPPGGKGNVKGESVLGFQKAVCGLAGRSGQGAKHVFAICQSRNSPRSRKGRHGWYFGKKWDRDSVGGRALRRAHTFLDEQTTSPPKSPERRTLVGKRQVMRKSHGISEGLRSPCTPRPACGVFVADPGRCCWPTQAKAGLGQFPTPHETLVMAWSTV